MAVTPVRVFISKQIKLQFPLQTVTVLNNIVVEGDDSAVLDDPTDADYKHRVRRGVRKRITTNRQRALLVSLVVGKFFCSCPIILSSVTLLGPYCVTKCLSYLGSFLSSSCAPPLVKL